MGLINKLGQATKTSGNFLRKSAEEYIVFTPELKQVTLKPKMVLFLCKKAMDKVDKLSSLEPHPEEGLIATVVHEKVTVKIHFTPEKIILKGDIIEGELRFLKTPEFETDSIFYRSLISTWKVFLGGYIPNDKLPDGISINGDRLFYTLPKNQLKLINLLFSSLKDESALNLQLIKGELIVTSQVAINWRDLNFQELFKMLNVVRAVNPT